MEILGHIAQKYFKNILDPPTFPDCGDEKVVKLFSCFNTLKNDD